MQSTGPDKEAYDRIQGEVRGMVFSGIKMPYPREADLIALYADLATNAYPIISQLLQSERQGSRISGATPELRNDAKHLQEVIRDALLAKTIRPIVAVAIALHAKHRDFLHEHSPGMAEQLFSDAAENALLHAVVTLDDLQRPRVNNALQKRLCQAMHAIGQSKDPITIALMDQSGVSVTPGALKYGENRLKAEFQRQSAIGPDRIR